MKYSAMLVAVGALSAGTAFAQEPIKIGVLYPLTGGGAVYGVPAMAGHQLAVEELNAKGGIMGRKIESIERDDKLNPAAASSTMKELITKDKVDIVLGGLASSVGLAMSEVSKQEKVVYISTIPKTCMRGAAASRWSSTLSFTPWPISSCAFRATCCEC